MKQTYRSTYRSGFTFPEIFEILLVEAKEDTNQHKKGKGGLFIFGDNYNIHSI